MKVPSGTVVSLHRLEAVDGIAAAGGETSGPAIRVTVGIDNTTSKPIDLGYVVVNAYTGKDRAPAGTVMQPGGDPFEGSLASGKSATGVYLFSIVPKDRKDVTITVDYGVGEPVVVFEGDLS